MIRVLVCVALLSVIDVAQSRATNSPQIPEGFTVHNVIRTWSEALSQCKSEGAILASPINYRVLKAMKCLIGITNAAYYIGTKAEQHPGQFVSLEGVPLENMTASLWQQLDPWQGDCLSMTSDRLHVVPCKTRLPYLCYKSDAFKIEKTTCSEDVAQSRATNLLQIPEGFTVHNVIRTWSEALSQCKSEGAILASPVNDQMLNAMESVIGITNAAYYIGTKAEQHSGQFISLEGVSLENMTASLWQPLDPRLGDCLSMTSDRLHVVPCVTRLPYICYNRDASKIEKTTCSEGYTYDLQTRHCYKIHSENVYWYTARSTCLAEGANLVVIDNDVEAESIKTICGPGIKNIWVGLEDTTGRGDWTSVHGQPVEELFNKWVPGGKQTDESYRCAVFITSSSTLASRKCVHVMLSCPFICEKEPS